MAQDGGLLVAGLLRFEAARVISTAYPGQSTAQKRRRSAFFGEPRRRKRSENPRFRLSGRCGAYLRWPSVTNGSKAVFLDRMGPDLHIEAYDTH